MDLLSRRLSGVSVIASSLSYWSLPEPWGVEISNFEPGFCLFVQSGSFTLSSAKGRSQKVEKGQVVFAPTGADCCLQSQEGVGCIPLEELPWSGPPLVTLDRLSQPESPQTMFQPGNGERTKIIGAAFTLGSMEQNSFVSRLHELNVVEVDETSPVSSLVAALEQMLSDKRVGYLAAANNLVECTVSSLLREILLNHSIGGAGWFNTLSDEALFQLLSDIHDNPAHAWSLQEMSSRLNMSRSTFIRRFKQQVGQSPMDYVIASRVELAADLLARTDYPITDICLRTGFNSDRALRMAFGSRYKQSPSRYRAKARD